MMKTFIIGAIVFLGVCLALYADPQASLPPTQPSSATGPATAPSKEDLEKARQVFRQLIGKPLADADKARVEKLLVRMGSNDSRERDEAEMLLKKESIDALPLIHKACKSDDAETAARAKKIVDTCQLLLQEPISKFRQAILTRQSAKDATMVGDLIELMDSYYYSVRQPAGRSLFRCTGQDFGYKAEDDQAKRAEAVKKASQWWDKNKAGFVIKELYGSDADLILDLGNNVTMKFVLIPDGKFMMGSPESEAGRYHSVGPRHEVTLTKPFYMGICEVTQEQYEQVIGENPSRFKGANNPVEHVNWEGAVEFCKKLSQKTGKAVHLPAEAQWEYACRAGSTTRFYYGDDENKLDDYAWYQKNSERKTHPVGQKKPNNFGLYDMHGNVWEWCADWWAVDYKNAINTDPTGPDSGREHVLRGGDWQYNAGDCQSSLRYNHNESARVEYRGFRVVVDLK